MDGSLRSATHGNSSGPTSVRPLPARGSVSSTTSSLSRKRKQQVAPKFHVGSLAQSGQTFPLIMVTLLLARQKNVVAGNNNGHPWLHIIELRHAIFLPPVISSIKICQSMFSSKNPGKPLTNFGKTPTILGKPTRTAQPPPKPENQKKQDLLENYQTTSNDRTPNPVFKFSTWE